MALLKVSWKGEDCDETSEKLFLVVALLKANMLSTKNIEIRRLFSGFRCKNLFFIIS